MPHLKRRHFLQFGGTLFAALGYSQLDWQHITQHYGQALAKGGRRKRALLVGIGAYTGERHRFDTDGIWYPLRGAVNDVMLQKELLMHRFGFHKDDIVMLTDANATRANILKHLEALVRWVKSENDVVVFHYSGHGSTVIDPNQVFTDHLNGTIVPFDGYLPFGYPQTGGEVNDITAGTIVLLRDALGRKTNHVTFILDSCYSGGGVRGNLTFRSRPGQVKLDLENSAPLQLTMSAEEQAYQQRWLTDLQLSQEEWIQRRQDIEINGAAIAACRRNQRAVDAAVTKDFHAGVFTYALTRHLWQLSREQGMADIVVATAAKTEQFLKGVDAEDTQTPKLEVRQGSTDRQQPIYYTPLLNPPAEAVVTHINGQSVDVLLTGLEPEILEAFGKGAVFTAVDEQGTPRGTVEIVSRNRIQAKGRFKSQQRFRLKPGTALQEQVRSLPSDLNLRIGLDPSLGQEYRQAKQALAVISRVEVVPLLEQEVHYILGRMSPEIHQLLERRIRDRGPRLRQQAALEQLFPVDSVGLFSVGLEPIPGTFRHMGVEDAVANLHTKVKVLLAARLVKLTLNTTSSRVNVKAQLQVDQQAHAAQAFTVRGESSHGQGKGIDATTPKLLQIPIGEPVQLTVKNRDYRNLYLAVLLFSPDGDIDIIFPLGDGQDIGFVESLVGELDVSQVYKERYGGPIKFKRPLGVAEFLILASTTSIQKALIPIQLLAQKTRSEDQAAERVVNAVASLLDDLAFETRSSEDSDSVDRLFNPKQMAALSIPFEIVGLASETE